MAALAGSTFLATSTAVIDVSLEVEASISTLGLTSRARQGTLATQANLTRLTSSVTSATILEVGLWVDTGF